MATEQKTISSEAVKEIEALFHHVPQKKNAGIDALKIVQKHHRWVSDEALREVADLCEMSYHELDGVATFYNIIFRQPVGRHVIMICDSVSCWVCGYEGLLEALEKKLEIKLGQTTPDDRFTLLPIPCLGTCDHAPALVIDEDLHRDLTTDQLDDILAKYE